jgi:formylglycine-generating enzyme required for sulfatase activity
MKYLDFINFRLSLLALLFFCSCNKSPETVDENSHQEKSKDKNVVKAPIPVPLPNWLIEVKDANYPPIDKLAPGSRDAQESQRVLVNKELPLEVRLKKSEIPFRLVPSGSFNMGSKTGRYLETLVHKVTLTENFYCGKFELTQENWLKVMKKLPKQYQKNNITGSNNLPLVFISWHEIHKFLRVLETLEGMPSNSLSLLTEAQWEYACRAGTNSEYYFGDVITSDLANITVPKEDSAVKTPRARLMPIGGFPPNAFGLYNMHGNVTELCLDLCGDLKSKYHVDEQSKNSRRQGGENSNLVQMRFKFRNPAQEIGDLKIHCRFKVLNDIFSKNQAWIDNIYRPNLNS